ncbi:MAG TPA: hypothetical protein VJS65_05365, partial [Verrucomicrobiae bacterium]|nr:hypothetical protein [Verrucomicrobiae bacterium]
MPPHPALSPEAPEERVSVTGSFEVSMIAGFVPAADGSSGTLVLDVFAGRNLAIVQRPTRIRSQKKAASLTPSPRG